MSEKRIALIAVPVCVSRASELAAAIERASRVADIIELRFDCLDETQLDEARSNLGALMEASAGRPFIFTFRPSEEGGRRAIGIDVRAGFWRQAAKDWREGEYRAPAFADVELELFERHAFSSSTFAFSSSTFEECQVICSHHDFDGVPADLEEIYERMTHTPAHVLKIAFRAGDITDCVAVFRLLARARREGRKLIAVAMGGAGVTTRILGPSRGAFLTYGSLDESQATAPGQIGADELRSLYRVGSLDEHTFITGLVGSPVAHSLSPLIHNAAFRARELNGVYLPFEVGDVGEFVRRMVHPRTREFDWNLRGFGVTAPHKTEIMKHLDEIELTAREVGAVNTVVVRDGRLVGDNTDAAAALIPLQGLLEISGARVAVIGAGGAARALLRS
ncbi:MAG: type I 3-dehydroquinate dehydratase, partial [Pyrinomonadaceae bacterium]